MLLNEKRHSRKSVRKLPPVSVSKRIGQRPIKDSTPFELQRARVASQSIIKFQNQTTKESYELDEEEMERFSSEISRLEMINKKSNHPDTEIAE